MSASDPVTELVPPRDTLLDAAGPRFRTVTTPKGRAGIRIEHVFWEAISDISEQLGVKRQALLSNVIERARAGELNVASALRTYVAMVQRTELETLRANAGVAHLARLYTQAPIPSFCLSRQKKLIHANAEFVHYVRALSRDPASNVSPDVAQLSLDRTLEQIFAELRSEGASLTCTLTVRLDDRARRASCKVVAIPPTPSPAIVGYVLGPV